MKQMQLCVRVLRTLLLAVPVWLTAQSAWAVYTSANGMVLQLKSNTGQPLANVQLSGILTNNETGEQIEVSGTTDDQGRIRVCRDRDEKGQTEEEDKVACGLIIPGDGTIALNNGLNIGVTGNSLNVPFYQTYSPYWYGVALIPVAYVALDDSDNNGGGSPPPATSPPPSTSPPGNTTITGKSNVNCVPTQNPQGSFQFLAGDIIGQWTFAFNTANGSLTATSPRGVKLTGSKQGTSATATGTGPATGVVTGWTLDGDVNIMPNGWAVTNFRLGVGPPLGGGSSDFVVSDCFGN